MVIKNFVGLREIEINGRMSVSGEEFLLGSYTIIQ
jgi:hypothetical protein